MRTDRKVFTGAAIWAALSVWHGRVGGPLQDRLLAPYQEEARSGSLRVSARAEGDGVVIISHDAQTGVVTEDFVLGSELELMRVIPLESARKELAQDEKRLVRQAAELEKAAEEERLAAVRKARDEEERKRVGDQLEAAARKLAVARNEAQSFEALEEVARARALADGIEFGAALGLVVAEINSDDWAGAAPTVAVPGAGELGAGDGLNHERREKDANEPETLADLAKKAGS